MKTQRLITVLVLSMLGASLGCDLFGTPTLDVYDIERNLQGTGTIFIWAVTNDDEQLASSLLSTQALSSVTQECQDGKVIACFDETWRQEWHGVQNIYFQANYSHGSIAAFQIASETGDRASWIVLDEVQENGQWRIAGWRGLINGKGEIPEGLIDGTNRTNAFPPDQ